MAKNPPANAGDTGLVSGQGRSRKLHGSYAHAPQLLSPPSRGRELQLLKPECLEPVLRLDKLGED